MSRSDAVLAAEIQHLLRFGDAADQRAGESAAANDQIESRHWQRLRRRADQRQRAVAA